MDEYELQRIADDLLKKKEAENPVEEPDYEEMEPPTDEQKERADQLLRQMMLAKQRGQATVAQKLLDEAFELVPNYAPVIEAQGDDLVERRQYRKAKEKFALALKFDPNSVSIENKYGEMVLKVDLRIDPATYDSGTMASGRGAVVMNALIPGLGHLVIGKTIHGVLLLAGWAVCWVFILLPGGVGSVLGALGIRQSTQPLNILTLLGLIGAAFLYIFAVSSASGAAKRMTPVQIEKPVPPVDKEF